MWVAALWGALIQIVGTLVGRALISAGVGVVAFTGMSASVAWVKDHFFTSVNGLPAAAIQALGLMQVDTAVEMLCSAILMRLAFKGMSAAGTIKSFVAK